VSFNWDSA